MIDYCIKRAQKNCHCYCRCNHLAPGPTPSLRPVPRLSLPKTFPFTPLHFAPPVSSHPTHIFTNICPWLSCSTQKLLQYHLWSIFSWLWWTHQFLSHNEGGIPSISTEGASSINSSRRIWSFYSTITISYSANYTGYFWCGITIANQRKRSSRVNNF